MEWMITRTGFLTEFFALIRLALVGDARATFPRGEGFGIRIVTGVTLVHNDSVFQKGVLIYVIVPWTFVQGTITQFFNR